MIFEDFKLYFFPQKHFQLTFPLNFQAFSRPQQIQNTEFGLETGATALQLFESAFEMKYNLEKLDQVALPVFRYGGMVCRLCEIPLHVI